MCGFADSPELSEPAGSIEVEEHQEALGDVPGRRRSGSERNPLLLGFRDLSPLRASCSGESRRLSTHSLRR